MKKNSAPHHSPNAIAVLACPRRGVSHQSDQGRGHPERGRLQVTQGQHPGPSDQAEVACQVDVLFRPVLQEIAVSDVVKADVVGDLDVGAGVDGDAAAGENKV